MAEPTEYRNRRGKSMWQPTLANGARLWRGGNWAIAQPGFSMGGQVPPVLLKSKWRARRAARKEELRRVRAFMDETFKEVSN